MKTNAPPTWLRFRTGWNDVVNGCSADPADGTRVAYLTACEVATREALKTCQRHLLPYFRGVLAAIAYANRTNSRPFRLEEGIPYLITEQGETRDSFLPHAVGEAPPWGANPSRIFHAITLQETAEHGAVGVESLSSRLLTLRFPAGADPTMPTGFFRRYRIVTY